MEMANSLPDLYRTMVTIRQFETTAARLLAQNRLPGFLHLSIGQEATATGVCAVLRREDYITSTHRGHGHCIAKGGDLGRMMAELFGHAAGYCKGRSGSMHIADPDLGILGANGIVAGGLGMAVGAALSISVRRSEQVVVAFFGEGAVAEGLFHESLNMAALWKLPVVFVCENNQYAEMGHVSSHLASQEVSRFAGSYGIPGVTAYGNDVLAVRDATAEAVGRARAGGGPTLLEFRTYRWGGHFEGDPGTYRPAAEVAAWKEQDPILRFEAALLEGGNLDKAGLARIAEEAEAAVVAAVAFAEAGGPGDEAVLLEDVYSTPVGQ